jgi:hypothetical protein
MVVSLVGLLLLPPIPQDQSYHQFADQRILLGMPNFWNVVSNLPFIAVGAAGLWRFHHHSAIIVLFLGYFLLASARPTIIGIDAVIALNNRTKLWHACQIAAIELASHA